MRDGGKGEFRRCINNAALRMSFEEFLVGSELLGNYDGTLFEFRSLMFQHRENESLEEHSERILMFMAKAVNINPLEINWKKFTCLKHFGLPDADSSTVVAELEEVLEEIVSKFSTKYFSENVNLKSFLERIEQFQQRTFGRIAEIQTNLQDQLTKE